MLIARTANNLNSKFKTTTIILNYEFIRTLRITNIRQYSTNFTNNSWRSDLFVV